jgi:tetratricopeptide (TPR) repeat protein
LNHGLSLDPKQAEAWLYRGVVWFDKKDYLRAIADFDEALKLNPRLADAYCSRGATWLLQGKPAEAEDDFARCRSLGGAPKPEAAAMLREMKARRVSK